MTIGQAPEIEGPGGGLQPERTALAWERTAVAMMVAGVLFARYATEASVGVLSAVGIAQTVLGAAMLVWAGFHYEDLHGPIQAGGSVVHPGAVRLLGVSTVAFSGSAVGLAAIEVALR